MMTSQVKVSNLRTLFLTIVCVSTMLVMAGCSFRSSESAGNVGVGDEAPAFYLKTPEGKAVGSDDLKGQGGYVVAVFATWCPPCKMELQAFEKEIWTPLKDSKVGVYAINFGDETADQIAQFARDNDLTFPLLVDEEGNYSKAVGVTGVPTTLVVDKNGRIIDVHTGYSDQAVAAIKRQLIEQAGS